MVLSALRGLLAQTALRLQRSLPVQSAFRQKVARDFVCLHRPLWEDPPSRRTGILQRLFSFESRRPGAELERLCAEGHLDEALDILLKLDRECALPSVKTYGTLLKACGEAKALAQAKRVHAHLVKHRLQLTKFLGEYLVSTLLKCGSLEDGIQVFQKLSHRTVFSWTAVIAGYTTAGQGEEALRLYDWMQEEGVQPNTYTFVSLLKACASISNLDEGKRIHAEAVKYGCGSDLFVGTCLVDMYAKCGSITEARNVFDGLSQRNVVSWTALLAAFVQQGDAEQVLQLYEQMWEEGVCPDVRAFVSTIQACGVQAEKEEGVVVDGQSVKVKSLKKGREIHAAARMKNCSLDIFVCSTLISMYGKCGSLVDSQRVVVGLSHPNVVSWTALLSAYVQESRPLEALHLYEQMLEKGSSANDRTFVTVLQACGMLAEKDVEVGGVSTAVEILQKGKAIHAETTRKGFDADVFVSSSLVNMYSKCGSIADAQNVFGRMSVRNVVSWNGLLVGYAEKALAEKALQLYETMLDEGMTPDVRTFVSVLQACGTLAEKEQETCVDGRTLKTRTLNNGKALHAAACRKGYDVDIFLCNTLICMYAKCGSILDAQNVFHELSEQNVVSWNAMLTAYVEQGQAQKALQLYEEMQVAGFKVNEVTLLCILQACSCTGSLEICRQIHQYLVSNSNHFSPLVSTTLIHAYGICGSMGDAQTVFDALPQPGVVSWNALVAGYAREGSVGAILVCYEEMKQSGVKPDGVTFLSLLSSCSHAGLVEKGVEYFKSMVQDHGLTPEIEHYSCMVDLLGRAGCFERVEDLLSRMPLQPTLSMWLCLLSACRKHHKVELGEHAFNCAVHLQPQDPAAYVLLSNIYADSGMLNRSNEVHELRRKAGAWKMPGQSWIRCEEGVHTFMVGENKEPLKLYDVLGKVSSELEGKFHIE